MTPFGKLTLKEKESLLKLPVYISLLAGSGEGILDEAEKKAALNFANVKSFSCHTTLKDFYREVDRTFENNLELINAELPKEKAEREAAIRKEQVRLQRLVLKLGRQYAARLQKSMKSFSEHVHKAHHSVMMDFILPLQIPGLTDR